MRRARHARRLLLAAALAPLIALAAAVVAASLLTGTRAGSPDPAARPAAPAAPPGPAGAVPARVPLVPRISLAGVNWRSYHGVGLPSSPAAGPHDTAGGLASGFADTPLGALLATLNIAVRANAQWGPGIFGPVIRRQVTGPDAAALLAGCQAAYDQAARAAHIAGGRPLGAAYVTEQAFRWVTYTPSAATVDLVSAAGQRRPDRAGRHPDRGHLGRCRLAGRRPAGRRLGQRGIAAALPGRVHPLPGPGVRPVPCPVLLEPACLAGRAISGTVGAVAGAAAGRAASDALSGIAAAIESGVAFVVSDSIDWWVRLPSPGLAGEPAVAELQQWMFPFSAAVAVLGMIIAGGKMALTRKASPLIDAGTGLVTIAATSAVGVLLPSLLLKAGDAWSDWVLNASTGGQFAARLTSVLVLGGNAAPAVVVVLGILGIIISAVQAVLMLFRQGALVILAGMLPLAAAGTLTPATRPWFRKTTGWMLALIFYKRAAAAVYATAFTLIGAGKDLRTVLMGFAMVLMSLLALPVLIRFFTWTTGAVTDSAAGGGFLQTALSGAAAVGALRGSAGGSGSPAGQARMMSSRLGPQPAGPAGARPAGSVPAGAASAAAAARAGAGGSAGAASSAGVAAGAAGGPAGLAAARLAAGAAAAAQAAGQAMQPGEGSEAAR